MFCEKFGLQISEGQAFCGNCGAPAGKKQYKQNILSQSYLSQGKVVMHCPRCGNTRLQVQANNRITSSVSFGSAIGKKHAIRNTAYNSIAETFWFCPGCGMKFRDLDELQQIITQRKGAVKGCKIFLIIVAIIFILFGFYAKSMGDTGYIVLRLMTATYIFFLLLPFGLLWLWAANDAKNKENEYKNLLPKVRRKE